MSRWWRNSQRSTAGEARKPFINTDQGDLLLFVFLLAGTIGGFAAGYYWKELTGNKGQKNKEYGNL